MSLVQEADVKTSPDVGLTLQVRDDVYTLHTLEESCEVEVLVLQVDVETISEVRHRIVNPSLVKLSNLTIMVEVSPAHTSKTSTFLSGMVIDFFLALEDTIAYISYLCTHRMTDNTLHAITTKGTISCYSSRQRCNFVAIRRDIGCDVILQTEVGLVAITDIELETAVLHLACINPL